jgi:hypothetical protein
MQNIFTSFFLLWRGAKEYIGKWPWKIIYAFTAIAHNSNLAISTLKIVEIT